MIMPLFVKVCCVSDLYLAELFVAGFPLNILGCLVLTPHNGALRILRLVLQRLIVHLGSIIVQLSCRA